MIMPSAETMFCINEHHARRAGHILSFTITATQDLISGKVLENLLLLGSKPVGMAAKSRWCRDGVAMVSRYILLAGTRGVGLQLQPDLIAHHQATTPKTRLLGSIIP